MSSATAQAHPGRRALRVIGVFKLFKGLLLLLTGIAMFHLLHRDLVEMVSDLADQFNVDPENRYLAALLANVGLLDDRKLATLGAVSFFYAALFATEGIGLWRGKRWAEYLTVVATCSLIPVELFEFIKRVTWLRGGLLAGNVAIVAFLIVMLKRGAPQKTAPKPLPAKQPSPAINEETAAPH